MPEVINLKFSDPYLLTDPNSKSVFEYAFYCNAQVERDEFVLNLGVLSPDDQALRDLGEPLVAVVNPYDEEDTQGEHDADIQHPSLLIKRTTTAHNVDDSLSNTNLIINLDVINKRNQGQPTLVELDIDPKIKFDIKHVFTFTFNKFQNNKGEHITVTTTENNVNCQLFDRAKNVLDVFNSVAEDRQATILSKTELRDLINTLADPIWQDEALIGGIDPKHELQDVEASTFYALVITGIGNKDGLGGNASSTSTYGLKGRIQIQPNQIL